MRMKLILLILVAGGAAFGAVTLARGWLDNRRAELAALQQSKPVEVETIDTVEVLVAETDMPSGTFLSVDKFVWTAFPTDGLPAAYFTRAKLDKDVAEGRGLDGAVLRGAITVGEPLTEGRVVRPGDRGFLAAVLKPGLRAVSVPIDATSGIAGFVFPGDRVDMLLTHEINVGDTKRRATETVLNDIRVLAVDQRTDDTQGKPALAKTATLEVSSQQAEVIAVALSMGRLSLALRSLAQINPAPAAATPSDVPSDTKEERTYTWDTQASQLLGPRRQGGGTAPAAPPAVTVSVVRRGEVQTVKLSGVGQ